MEFVIFALDREDGGEMRRKVRAAHLGYLADRQKHVKFGGPILSKEGRTTGSVLILEFPDRAALDAHLASDPYFNSGMFEAVLIRETRQVVPETEPGQLAQEIARQKALT